MDSRCFRDERGFYIFPAGGGPTDVERTEALRAIAVLRADLNELAVDGDPSIGTVVMMLHVAMHQQVSPQESAAVTEVWTKALVGVPAAAIEAAYDRFTQGAAKGMSRSFMPKVPEFAGLARDIAAEWSFAARRLEVLLGRPVEQAEEATLSPAGVAKLADWRKKFGGAL
ncbi:hypothetical protein [Aureimonas leprariae]|uniref:hypothetical protein n=1 Tax=Plantimonas leprariae TaxID=2615207 RepID=UPI001386CCE0|nr:hypothetical protein [Aureimonas leprariae]